MDSVGNNQGIDPYELPPGRARRDRLYELLLPIHLDDFTSEEQAELLTNLAGLRAAILASRDASLRAS